MPTQAQNLPSIKRAQVRTPLGLIPDYLHVGLHKTGTTFLQKNIFPLLEPEIRYVRKPEALILDGEVVTNRPNVVESLGASSGAQGPFLLSQEALAGGLLEPDLSAIRTMAARNPKLRVIVSLRSQVTIIPSMYFQVVKSGYRKSLAGFIGDLSNSGKLDYARFVENIKEIVGPGRVLVLLFEEFTGDPGAAHRRLCQFLDLQKPTPTIVAGREKVTASDDSIMAKRLCNRLFIAKLFGPRIERLTYRSLSAGLRIIAPHLRQRGNRYRLSARQAETAAAQYGPGNTKLLSEFGYTEFAGAYMADPKITHGEAPQTSRHAGDGSTRP